MATRLVITAGLLAVALAAGPSTSPRLVETGAASFLKIAGVLRSPRCQNCHPAGEQPLQGDQGAPHGMEVQRGPDGRGVSTVRCSNCHQLANGTAPHTPPGVRSGWRMPPAGTPMVFQGRSAGQLCRQLLDPAQSHQTQAGLVEHVTSDPLVLWGWEPGPGRTPPSMSHAEFVALVTAWVKAGAACPG